MLKQAVLCVLLFFTLVNTNFSADELNTQPIVDEINITGLWRTKPSVVLRELLFKENDILTTSDLLASVQRLKNLQVFSQVIPLLVLKPNNKVKLTLQMQEKWTTIPYMSISAGGGTTYAYAGIYDINTFGRLIETGIQYDNWDGRHGGLAWMRNPRFLNKRLLFGFDLWSIQRVRQLYAQNSASQGSYSLETKKINLLLKKEITPMLHIGSSLEVNKSHVVDSETTDIIDAETRRLLNNNNSNTTTFATLFVDFGKIDHDSYLVSGKYSQTAIKYSNKTLGSVKPTFKIDITNKFFWRLPYQGNAGFLLKTGWTNTQEIQNLYYIGGFENIRGYSDGQFRSKTYWQFNAEYRIPSYRSNWLVLQHVVFIDAAGTGNHLDDLKNNGLQYSSAGIGLRIISPRIYSFNGRIDIAMFTSGNSLNSISFSSQQYF